jgi:hypothetical protein
VKFLYKPVGLLVSVLGGLIPSALFRRVWRAVAHEDEAPAAKDPNRGWSEIALAALLEGAIFAAVKALVDKAVATAFARATGEWPT